VKLAFLFGPFSTYPRPLDFANMQDSPRGLTGTDNSFVGYAKAMRDRGHEVLIYAEGVEPTTWEGCEVFPYSRRGEVGNRAVDAVLVWNDVAGLDLVPPTIPRILDMQVNDVAYASKEALGRVDLFVAPSQSLIDHLRRCYDRPGACWEVLPNGCDPDAYDLSVKIPGRCIHASSTDRGLHILLQRWPRIRAAVPHASLRIFYHTLPQFLAVLDEPPNTPELREKHRRAHIIKDALPKLESQDVVYVGGVSRRRMATEYSLAECLTYPCDTMRGYPDGWGSEGFGVAVLEGCASGAVPVTSDCDAFGEVYTGACPVVKQGEGWVDTWERGVIELLTDASARDGWVEKGRGFAALHAWPVLAARLETVVAGAMARKAAA
jgi:glycosyltransferase involved in cell wall biosynthesis